MAQQVLNKTPLSTWHHSHGGKMVDFEGWDMPVQYESGILAEHLATLETKGYLKLPGGRGGALRPIDAALNIAKAILVPLAGLITFGSNIPLFTLGLEQVKPIAFPPPGSALSSPVRAAARWMNYFDRDDVLGYPLREISSTYAATVHEDVSIGVGSLLSGWTPMSHTAYWNDADFVDRVADQVAAIAKAASA